jgi:hypothetical protein
MHQARYEARCRRYEVSSVTEYLPTYLPKPTYGKSRGIHCSLPYLSPSERPGNPPIPRLKGPWMEMGCFFIVLFCGVSAG